MSGTISKTVTELNEAELAFVKTLESVDDNNLFANGSVSGKKGFIQFTANNPDTPAVNEARVDLYLPGSGDAALTDTQRATLTTLKSKLSSQGGKFTSLARSIDSFLKPVPSNNNPVAASPSTSGGSSTKAPSSSATISVSTREETASSYGATVIRIPASLMSSDIAASLQNADIPAALPDETGQTNQLNTLLTTKDTFNGLFKEIKSGSKVTAYELQIPNNMKYASEVKSVHTALTAMANVPGLANITFNDGETDTKLKDFLESKIQALNIHLFDTSGNFKIDGEIKTADKIPVNYTVYHTYSDTGYSTVTIDIAPDYSQISDGTLYATPEASKYYVRITLERNNENGDILRDATVESTRNNFDFYGYDAGGRFSDSIHTDLGNAPQSLENDNREFGFELGFMSGWSDKVTITAKEYKDLAWQILNESGSFGTDEAIN